MCIKKNGKMETSSYHIKMLMTVLTTFMNLFIHLVLLQIQMTCKNS